MPTTLALAPQRPLLPGACVALRFLQFRRIRCIYLTPPPDNAPMQVEMRDDFTDFKTCLCTSDEKRSVFAFRSRFRARFLRNMEIVSKSIRHYALLEIEA